MECELNALLAAYTSHICPLFKYLFIVRAVDGSKLVGHGRKYKILYTDGLIHCHKREKIVSDVVKLKMSGNRLYLSLTQRLAHILCCQAVKTRELYAVVAHLLKRLECSDKVTRRVVADRINLDSNRKCHSCSS